MELSFVTVDNVCAAAISADEEPSIDLSRVTFFRPFALVYLGMFLRYHNSCGRNCCVVPPNNLLARNYLARQQFWERFNFSADVIEMENLRRFTTSTSLNDIVDIEKRDYIAEDIADGVKRVLRTNHVRVNSAEIAGLVCELVDNFSRHSERELAAFHMQYYPNRRQIALAFGDCGIGIRESLASNPTYAHLASRPHSEAALKAFEPLVSRASEGGTGLTEVKDGVMSLNGNMVFSTGNGYVRINNAEIQYGEMMYDLPGVQIGLSFLEE